LTPATARCKVEAADSIIARGERADVGEVCGVMTTTGAVWRLLAVCVAVAMLGCAAASRTAPRSSAAASEGACTYAEPALVDLTYPFDARTVYWPTSTPFRLRRVARGQTGAGYWYAANDFSAAEHGGTHLDAPIHFAENGWTTDQVPLGRLIGPAAVIDIRARARDDADAELTVADIEAWERAHGRIPPGTIVFLHSGWGAHWPDAARYLGSSAKGTAARLRFPGFSRAGAEFLVRERSIDAVGTDTASIDPGRSRDFLAHRIFAAANVPALENVANLDRLPPAGAVIIALPMKIGGGTGGPVRVMAVLPDAR
jgi:kynurenine formamidase